MNTIAVMQLITASAAASANPLVFVPALDSRPKFFLSTEPWPFHQPPPVRLVTAIAIETVSVGGVETKVPMLLTGLVNRKNQTLQGYNWGLN